MNDNNPDREALPAAQPALDREGWLTLLDNMGESSGYFEPLGDHHWAVFSDDGKTLLVTFDRLEDIQANDPGKMPFCYGLATKNGWSHLSVISEGESWYRDPAIYRYLDKLVDDAFFDNFSRVVFYGAEMGGYAACAFSVAAPGSTVVAVSPRATLDPSVSGWDKRHLAQRRLNFTDRYGYAPDMTEGASEVFVIHDPRQTEDAMHAALFGKPFVTQLRARFSGPELSKTLEDMKLLPKIVQAAADRTLTKSLFDRLYRARRNDGNYLRRILHACIEAGRPLREAMICRSVTTRMRAPGFRRHLTRLEESGVLGEVTATAEQQDA
tara:strand:- start:2873 stop:3847 length:975 start_codon:yes stop_codon:yes gene_type:complete